MQEIPESSGFRLKCPNCKTFFVICASCYRGHLYCGKACSKIARRLSLRRSARRYAKTPAAKRNHRLRQNRYRKNASKKNVTQQAAKISPLKLRPTPSSLTNFQQYIERSGSGVSAAGLKFGYFGLWRSARRIRERIIVTIDEEKRAAIRRLYFAEHYTVNAIVKTMGVHHETVKRIIEGEPKGRDPRPRPVSIVEAFRDSIDEHLTNYPKIRATRLMQILQDRGYRGSISSLRDYVKKVRPKHLKPYMKMVVRAGEQGQVDWAHVGTLKVGQAERKLYLFVMVLAYSRAIFAKFCLNQETSTFLRCHEDAFQYLGGCPRIILYDNLKSIVLARRGPEIRFNPEALDFAGYYCYEPRPCNPRRGNEKEYAAYYTSFIF